VLFVHLCFLLTNMQQKERALKIVKLSLNEKQRVYDLTVDGCSEFVAEGITAHNCLHYLCGYLGVDLSELNEPKQEEDTRRAYKIDEEIEFESNYREFE